MNRPRRVPLSKQFTPGGVYNPPRKPLISNVPKDDPPPIAANVIPVKVDVAPVFVPPPVPTPTLSPPDVLMADQEDDNADIPMEDNDVQLAMGESGKFGKAIFKKIFLKRKKSSVRLKEKKLRQNRQLRKSITPKNALMALNEVKGVMLSEFIITNAVNGGFTALVTVNNKQYEGQGLSKVAAKGDACEKALRDYVIEKMRLHPRLPKNYNNNGNNQMNNGAENTEANPNDNVDNGDDNDNEYDDDDDVPMVNLASFALFKLFSAWENEGFEIPELRPVQQNMSSNISNAGSESGSVRKEPNKPTIRTELPSDWKDTHPATLLCIMRPGLSYVDSAPPAENMNALQSIYTVVDGQTFVGVGRSKKIARRNAAIAACNQLFGTDFVETE